MGRRKAAVSNNWMVARRWTAEQGRAAVQALDSSGASVTAFAARHGIAAHRIYQWRRRLARETDARPTFVEVIDRERSERRGAFEIEFGSGDVLRVPPEFDAGAVRQLVSILRGGRPC
jgi:transposase-like protein